MNNQIEILSTDVYLRNIQVKYERVINVKMGKLFILDPVFTVDQKRYLHNDRTLY
jgi:phosphoribosylaminoimidazole-succinocarboxamide synthase